MTHITPKFIKDFKGYATKFASPDWDIYDTTFSEYLTAIDNIATCMANLNCSDKSKQEMYKKEDIESAISYIDHVARCRCDGYTISFANSNIIQSVNCTPETFAQAIQYYLMQQGRMFDYDRIDEAKTGRLDRVPLEKCDPITEQRMVSVAVNKMNDYLEQHPEVMPEKRLFNIGEYLDNANVM